jgi:hypothetical protein
MAWLERLWQFKGESSPWTKVDKQGFIAKAWLVLSHWTRRTYISYWGIHAKSKEEELQ